MNVSLALLDTSLPRGGQDWEYATTSALSCWQAFSRMSILIHRLLLMSTCTKVCGRKRIENMVDAFKCRNLEYVLEAEMLGWSMPSDLTMDEFVNE